MPSFPRRALSRPAGRIDGAVLLVARLVLACLWMMAAVLAGVVPALARGTELDGLRRPSPLARALPLVFDSERIRLAVVGDSLEVRGTYLLRCRGRSETPLPLLYPFPQDSLLGGFRFVSLTVQAGATAEATPAPWDSVPGQWFVRWWIPPCQSDTLVAEAVYRQALRADYARYIVTTTRAWGQPLRRAEFEIRLPAGAQPTDFSFPFQPSVTEAGLWTYATTDFLPDRDIRVRWRR